MGCICEKGSPPNNIQTKPSSNNKPKTNDHAEEKIITQDNESKDNKSPREMLRYKTYFQPVDEMNKEDAYSEFLEINSFYAENIKGEFPDDFFRWKDPSLVSKLESQIKQHDHNAELMNGLVMSKMIFDHHPETMDYYVSILRVEDFICQLLNRQLLIYKKFYPIIDDKTIEYVEFSKKEGK